MNTRNNIFSINSKATKFIRLNNAFDLSKLLCFEFNTFKSIIEKASYQEFTIPKSSGGKRTIEAPNENLIYVQRRLNKYLQAVYYKIKPDVVYGFVNSIKGEPYPKTIVTNAKKHIGKSYVLNIDLKNFFHAISATDVKRVFQSTPFNFSEDLATCLALICCWNKRLPMGAATSPVVSNLYCIGMDSQLISLANNCNLTYTRYADDLTFSSETLISPEIIQDIYTITSVNTFRINERKVRMQSKFKQQTVTGIKVNQKPNLERSYIRNLRATLQDIKLNGLEKATKKHYKVNEADEKLLNTILLSLSGKINFIGQVRGKDDSIYNKLKKELQTLISKE